MFTFREVTDDAERLGCRIRGVLGRRRAMHVGELRMRLGVDRTSVHTVLEAMMARGEVERLRPIGYPQEDHDFFRLNGRSSVTAHSGARATDSPQDLRDLQQHVRLAGEATVCLVY